MSGELLVIICAKGKSRRFKYKNKTLIESTLKELKNFKVAVATDCGDIARIAYSNGAGVIHRGKNAVRPDDSVFDIAKWAYMHCDYYPYIALVFANVINFNKGSLIKALDILKENNLNEVRSYNCSGEENGIIVMKDEHLMYGDFSTYCGAIITDAKEIHTEEELENELNRKDQ